MLDCKNIQEPELLNLVSNQCIFQNQAVYGNFQEKSLTNRLTPPKHQYKILKYKNDSKIDVKKMKRDYVEMSNF